jgi:hypothetical protein
VSAPNEGETAARLGRWDGTTVVLPGEGAGAALQRRTSRRGFCPPPGQKVTCNAPAPPPTKTAGDPDDAQDGVTRNGKGATDVCSISFKGGKPPREGE